MAVAPLIEARGPIEATNEEALSLRLAGVALLVLGMRAIDLLWLIVPAFHHHKEAVDPPVLSRFIYLAAIVGVSGLWFAYYLYQLRSWPLAAAFKPYAEGEAHGAVAQH